MADEPLTPLQQAFMAAVRPEPAGRITAPPPHDCPFAALVDGYVYPCRSHKDGYHHFAARWPACPAPYCRSEPGHRELHDIPSGRAVIADRSYVIRDEDAGIAGDPDSEVIYDRDGHGWHRWSRKDKADG
jgi:hypothetical protein